MFVPLAFHKESIVTRGLVFYVDAADRTSYSPSNTTWNDLTSNNNDGTLTNGPTFDSGNGGSIVFDGIDDHIRINSNFGVTSWPISISTWVRFSAFSGDYTAFSLGRFTISNAMLGFGNSSNRGRLWNYNGTFVQSITDLILDINIWYNMCAVYESDVVKHLYINGNLETSLTSSLLIPPNMDNATIGSLSRSANGGYWNGNISTTSVYNRALTPQEITQNYNAFKGRFGIL